MATAYKRRDVPDLGGPILTEREKGPLDKYLQSPRIWLVLGLETCANASELGRRIGHLCGYVADSYATLCTHSSKPRTSLIWELCIDRKK